MELTVEKLVYGGDGLARVADPDSGRKHTVFVPFVIEEERVQAALALVQPGLMRANLTEVLTPSRFRADPSCPYYTRCGGCHYQHMTYEHQLAVKAGILRETLQRIAKLELKCELQVHSASPWRYRNRTRLWVRSLPSFALGYYTWRSHALLPVEQCPISSQLINRAISVMWNLGRAGKVPASIRQLEFFCDAEDRTMQMLLHGVENEVPATGMAAFFEEFRRLLPELGTAALFAAEQPGRERPQARALAVDGSKILLYRTGRGEYRVSPGAFFQTNRFLVDELLQTATAGHSGRTALDLYAGVGLFATVLARSFERVVAVESSQISCSDLQYNAPENVKRVCSSVESFVRDRRTKMVPDLVLADPPRAGLGERVARWIADLGPKRISYVSCDPATLARDLVVLVKRGYHVEQAHLVDLFPQTYHLESVFQFAR